MMKLLLCIILYFKYMHHIVQCAITYTVFTSHTVKTKRNKTKNKKKVDQTQNWWTIDALLNKFIDIDRLVVSGWSFSHSLSKNTLHALSLSLFFYSNHERVAIANVWSVMNGEREEMNSRLYIQSAWEKREFFHQIDLNQNNEHNEIKQKKVNKKQTTRYTQSANSEYKNMSRETKNQLRSLWAGTIQG